uniref:ORF1ab polyprotein n=12 Tax=Orthocoronavirinae TaxID=2501931 RepID=A0AA49EEE2_9NIDO|nr:ORF1ab polyprotein [Bat Coronavirus EsJX20]WCC63184.1 ORF1ab polyprotein [Bat Coronavirus EsJX20]
MASSQLTLAVASDSEIYGNGFPTMGDAVNFYSSTAPDGFWDCRFVPFGLQDCVVGVSGGDYVVLLTGDNILRAFIGTFDERPAALRGWIIKSNSNFVLEEFDIIFGHRGGTPSVNTDQYLCGADGRPVLAESEWSFQDYFGNESTVTLAGKTYTLAWRVVRSNLPYNQQSVCNIKKIQYLTGVPHKLVDGTTLTEAKPVKMNKSVVVDAKFQPVLDAFGVPFVCNGTSIADIIAKPVFIHALVKCKCGTEQFAVGDWTGFKTLCCGTVISPRSVVIGNVEAGDVVFTSANAGTGVKYYHGITIRHVTTMDNVALWRVLKVQACNTVASSGNYVECNVMDPLYYRVNDKLTNELRMTMLGMQCTESVLQAAVSGIIDVSNKIVNFVDNIMERPPWFVTKLKNLLGDVWSGFTAFLHGLNFTSKLFVKFVKALCGAAFTVLNGAVKIVAEVPSELSFAFDKFCELVENVFNALKDKICIFGLTCVRAGDYLIFGNHIVELVRTKVVGSKQAGLQNMTYFATRVGPTTKVKATHVQTCDSKLTISSASHVLEPKGYAVVIDGLAYFCSGGVYRMMASENSVIESPVFVSRQTSVKVVCHGFDSEMIKCPATIDIDKDLKSAVDTLTSDLSNYNSELVRYCCKIVDGVVEVHREFQFVTPMFLKNRVSDWTVFCETNVDKPWFFRDYARVHSGWLDDVTVFTKEFLQTKYCPALFKMVDNGRIWGVVTAAISDLAEFCSKLKIDFGLDGFTGNCTKRFKKWLRMLLDLYNELLATVLETVVIAGVAFKKYAFEKPMLCFNGVLHYMHTVDSKEYDCAIESGVNQFTVVEGGTVDVKPKSIQCETLTLEEVDYTPPSDNGDVVISDGLAFYKSGTNYYLYGTSGILPCTFKRGGGVTFGGDEVREIPCVHKVHVMFEFEDENIVKVCEKVLGTKLKIEGDWQDLVQMIRTTLDTIAEAVEVPDYYIYDEQGGEDICLPVMVSQYAIQDDEDCCEEQSTDVLQDDCGDATQDDVTQTEESCDDQQLDVDVEVVDDIQDFDIPVAHEGQLGEEQHDTTVELVASEEIATIVNDSIEVTTQDTSECDTTPDVVKTEQAEVEKALSFIVEKPVVIEKPVFGYKSTELNSIRILKQGYNNCWVNVVTYQLQVANVLELPELDLFRVGRTEKLVSRCYQAIGAFKGSLGDANQCLSKLCEDVHTLFIVLKAKCDCGLSDLQLSGCVFYLLPTKESFDYGICPTCKQVRICTVLKITGTGFFCQEPSDLDIDSLVVDPRLSVVYHGARDGGHYLVNDYKHKLCIDGMGVQPITSARVTTLLVVDADYQAAAETEPEPVIKPFLVYKNIEFYQGAIGELVKLEHDFVVNAANGKLAHGGGVAKAIDDLTHGELQKLSNQYIKKQNHVPTGRGVMIVCRDLKVLNVVGPRAGHNEAARMLATTYNTIFKEPGVPLTPLISVGIFGMPIVQSLDAMIKAAKGRYVKCFVYLDEEVKAVRAHLSVNKIRDASANQTPVEEPVVVPTEPLGEGNIPIQMDANVGVSDEPASTSEFTDVEGKIPIKLDDVVTVSVEGPVSPCRVEGSFQFFSHSNIGALKPDKVLLWTNSMLRLGQVGDIVDQMSNGALQKVIAGYLERNKTVPAGNLVGFSCGLKFDVLLAVLPPVSDANYAKNLKRTVAKVHKIKGVVACEVSSCFDELKDHLPTSFKFVLAADSSIDECFKPGVVTVKVSHDGVNVNDVDTVSTVPIKQQLGPASIGDEDVSDKHPTALETSVINVAPVIDWDAHYGFPEAAVFHTMDHNTYAYEHAVVEGRLVLKPTDNNCWVNAVCLALQYLKPNFKHTGLEDLWNKFMIGDVKGFVHFLYHVAGAKKGEPGDAEAVLIKLDRYLVPSSTVTIVRSNKCELCKDTPITRNASVLPLTLSVTGVNDGFCQHNMQWCSRITNIDGDVIITEGEKPRVYFDCGAINACAYVAYTGDVQNGHYTVYDSARKHMYDGDKFVPFARDQLSLSSGVVKRGYKKIVAQPETVTVSRVIDVLDGKAEKFFSAGDFVFHNLCLFVMWLFTVFKLIYKACRKADLKIVAGVPERTGIIFKRSLKYNLKAFRKFMMGKTWYVTFLLKVLLLLYTVYLLGFMFIRYGPFNAYTCNSYVRNYVNGSVSGYDKGKFCANNPMCQLCLHGFDELSNYGQLAVTWRHLTSPFRVALMPFVYLAFLAIFGGKYMRCLVLYFIAQYVNKLGVYLHLQQNLWFVQLVPFDTFGDEIVVIFVVARIFAFIKHVLYGCEKTDCVACSRSARLTRIPMQTIVNGSSKSFYVNANGGKKFCNKHNFFCDSCDSYGPGNTFINDYVAKEVSNVVKATVQPTGPATITIDKVEFSDGFYRLYSGDVFWKYNYDITDAKFSCKEVLKSCNLTDDFIVYNNCGSNVTQVKNACVYLSQLLCKPIKLVDSALLSTLDVDFNGALHRAFKDVLQNSFSQDLSKCDTMAECKNALNIDASDEDFVNAVSNAHRYDVLLTENSFNNFITSYAKPEEKLSAFDVAQCMRASAKIVNHNVITKEKLSVVWSAKDFNNLSPEARKYVVKTTKAKGLNFLLTFNENVAMTQVPCISIVQKSGSGPQFPWRYVWFFCSFVITFYLALTYFASGSPMLASFSGFDFKYIENGQLKKFDTGISCVSNRFSNFDNWHQDKFGFIPSKSPNCPIVVGVSDAGTTIPGVPSDVLIFEKTLFFVIKTVFGDSNVCYDTNGVTDSARCIFNSACTTLTGLGGTRVFCANNDLVQCSALYSDIVPNMVYRLNDGNYIRVPEVLARGAGIRVVRTVATTYCRVGECVDSKQGVCFGADRWLVYNDETGADFVCGSSLWSLFLNVFHIFNNSYAVAALSGQITFNCFIAGVVVLCCYTFMKFKRVFGDLSYGVATVVGSLVVNNLSYFVTGNYITMFCYAFIYYFTTRTFKYEWVWHTTFVVAYVFLAPWWLVTIYVVTMLLEIVPNITKLKVTTQLFDGNCFVGTFESAASGTFVIDKNVYAKLVNSITPEKLKQHASSYNKYKYYSGAAGEGDYRLACYAHLAYAMQRYSQDQHDLLYTPPTVSFNSSLQAGLRKMAHPSGIVEPCIVRVAYDNMVLNGLWLGDQVFCPRHVIAPSTTKRIDYEYAYSSMRLHSFSISKGNIQLGVISAKMQQSLLVIKVDQSNQNTPAHCFRPLRVGQSFSILACYDGLPSSVYSVNMRTNFTVRGSFINGACGSPGFVLTSVGVEFVYMHHLELGSGCHVGSDFEGNMYGNYEDQPSLQVEGASSLVTENVVSFLYGAILNGCTWWCDNTRTTVDNYNEWAQQHGFTKITSSDGFSILAARTELSVENILSSIMKLSNGFGGKSILGFTSLTDEFTLAEVVKQMYGVTLQGGRKTNALKSVLLASFFFTLFWSEFVVYTAVVWIHPQLITAIFALLVVCSVILSTLIKHKSLFFQAFLLPAVIVIAVNNFAWDSTIFRVLSEHVGNTTALMGVDVQGVINIALCLIVMCVHTWRFTHTSATVVVTYLMSMGSVLYTYFYGGDYLSLLMMVLCAPCKDWFVGVIAYRVALFCTQFVDPLAVVALGHIKVVVFLYLLFGFFSCVYWGLLYWVNRFFKLTIGVYEFKVSAAEFKYMIANDLKAPTTPWDSLILSIRLMGIGGARSIKISSVQSKLTDLKCANVVLLGILSNTGVAANSREWNFCVELHNKINLSDNAEEAMVNLLTLIAMFISKHQNIDLESLIGTYFDNSAMLQSIASAYASMPAFVAYELARKNYEDAVANDTSPQLLKQLKRAMNIAKAEFDKDASVQKKITRMAETAAAQMYKEARAENKKSKVISALHSLLFNMLKRLDMTSVDNVLNLARNGVVPLSIIPTVASTKLNIVCPDLASYQKIWVDSAIHYAGVVWTIVSIKDNDGKPVHQKELVKSQEEELNWPLHFECERVVKLQNNEVMPTSHLKERAVNAEGEGCTGVGKAIYQQEGGNAFMYAFISDTVNLRFAKWETSTGVVVVELDPPCRFAVETPNGPQVKYLYFVKNLNTLRRGAVLGYIGATIRLQAGKQTELASNSSLLTLCAFACDPAKAYLDAVKSGVKPLSNCVKMLSNGSGNGQAITNNVEANSSQDSYGGASVCLYCRAHVEHPDMDGFCKLKGKYVQIPVGTPDPIRFCLENTPCKVCMCWLSNGCTCDRANVQSFDQQYLNRSRGSSAARLEPCNGTDTDYCVRAFDIFNKDVACIGKFPKVNCVRYRNTDKHDAFFVIKRCTTSVMEHEQSIYELLKDSNAVATHDFFTWKDGRACYGNISRQNLTKYTMMDLCFALRNFDEKDCETLKEILVLTGCCDATYFDMKSWYDPVENEDIWRVYAKLGAIVANAMLKCVALCDTMVAKGVIGVLTLDNQDLNGNFYDFGDFLKTIPEHGIPYCTSYYSYMMPVMGMTNCLASECFIKSDIFGSDFKTYDLLEYDFTEHKEKLFQKYFKYWGQDYHPNCCDCYDELCIVHCANFNTLFATTIPNTAFGPLCRKVFVDGVALVATAGYHFKQLGIVWNKDLNTHTTRLTITDLLKYVTDPTLVVSSSPALVDMRTVCFSVAALSTGLTQQTVKPGHFNEEFYNFLIERGFFSSSSELTLKHFFFAQKGDATIKDFDYYRYNKTTMLDICQARLTYKVVQRYFECYDGGCITAKEVVVTNLNKSAGWPLNKVGKAGLYYEALSYEEQDALYAFSKRNILPTMTQLNLKYAISGKERARTVGGVSLLSTMTTRQFHQKHLKSIVNARNAAVVIGTTKFYGGWDNMLKNLIEGVENPVLMGWDYPKCDRALPNMIRMISAMILGSKHVTCCTDSDRYYRLSNELAQVLTEVVYSNGGFYMKPGGTTSGDATTAYANSVFNIFQATSANINRLLSVDTNKCHNETVKSIQRRIYDNCYRASDIDDQFVTDFYNYLLKHFSLMILSDDGVVCYNKDYADMGYIANISAFKSVLYYQNNVFMSSSKCWTEEDINKGPHEFCSQHTMQIVDGNGTYYLPYPDPSRILSAGVFVDDVVKTDPVILLERYVSLAIDAYPLSKHEKPEYRQVFYVLLDWVKHLNKSLTAGILDAFSVTILEDSSSKFWTEEFYANMYEKSTVLQASGMCVVCGSQTVLRCGDCIRRPLLCTKCAYDHIISTPHKFIMSVTPYVCNFSGCTVCDVTKLFLGGLSYWCAEHKPQLSFPLCSGGNVFGLYKASATGSTDVELFNKLACSDWSDVSDYKLANEVKDSLRLFAAETIKATEECVKSQYASATLKEVIGNRELLLDWEAGKARPPLNRNSVFTGYLITKDSKCQIGEFTFEKADYGSDTVLFKTTSSYKLTPGIFFVLTSHNVAPLRAATIANQERYSYNAKLRPAFNISDSYSSLVPYYQLIARQRITTIQGPPGSGKSHCMVGLGLYYPGARIMFTACSHAATDSLCHKASTVYCREKCSRIVPARARVECFSGFKVNNNNAQYIFSTVNALPECVVDIVVVDEVSMCTNYDLSVINQRVSYKHIVYVGDPQQLPAPRTLITKGSLAPADYNVVTQRMCCLGPDVFLHKCYRCPAEIVDTVSEIVYENKFKPVKDKSRECFKLYARGTVHVDNGSSVNKRQLEIVKMFLAKNPVWSKAVFISPYNSQNYVASRMLNLQTQTVDSSQGSEYDYVIYAQTSDTNHACNVNRFNVAITRAKKGIFCIMSDKALFDKLKFYELKMTDLQATEGCGLFKNCYRNEVDLPPSHAPTSMALSDRFKVSDELAVAIGTTPQHCRYEHVISFMGFRFDYNVPDYHNMFCTRAFAMRHVRGWLGMDVEGAHVCGENIGTNVPLQIGFSNGVDFVVTPEGCVSTEVGDIVKPVKARAPPGEQFTHLIPLMRKGRSWTVVRRQIVQMVCDYLGDSSDVLIFVLWAGGLELTTMRYFVKVGPSKFCHCGKEARCYNSSSHEFCCFSHSLSCDYLYNPHCIDIQQWGYVGSLSLNHHQHCNVHRNEHVASGDAIMTRCLAVHDCFVKNVDWSITYPFIANENTINKSGRCVQSHVVRAMLKAYDPVAIHDIGNPKGIRCAVTSKHWYCYDKQPVNSNVKCLEYDYMLHGQMNGLCLFWNCNVDMYPEFSIVCRFDTRVRSKLNLEGCNGGSLYVNNHAFHTPAFDKRAFAKLKQMPFFYFDESACDLVQDQVNYVPLRANNCITKCNIGGAVCSKHANLYRAYVEAYNTFTSAGFTLWCPTSFDTFNLWQSFCDTKIQGLENIAFNVVKKGGFVNAPGELPVAIIGDRVMVREGVNDTCVFTNSTSLPTNIAFELYAKRKTGLTPPLTLLRNLGVAATYKHVLWDYEAKRPLTPYTIDVCKYTDFVEQVCTCFDNSIPGSLEKFSLTANAVLFSTTPVKKLSAIKLNFGYLNGVAVSETTVVENEQETKKPVTWYIYTRKDNAYVDRCDGFYSQGRTTNDFMPRSTMEKDFLELDTGLFINKYGLEDYNFEHVVYGDVSKTTLGGLHLLISQIRLSKMGVFKTEEFVASSDNTLKCCTVTYADNPSCKQVCTYMDLLLDDFVAILKSLDLSVVSKVHEVIVDCKPFRWMLWCEGSKVATFYPQLQSAEWKCGYSMPSLYKIQRMCLEPCNLYNYGASIKLPDGIMFNVVKYTQLCQYLNSTTMCVPHGMRVLHLGAGSDKGVAPGTAVLRRWLPMDAVIVDNDVNDYVSDADFSHTGDCTTLYLEDKFDLLVSDMYDGVTKKIDGENTSKDGFFTYINGCVREKLALGGTMAIKITECSWNKELYELAQKFAFWTLFCTSVNTSSSEAFLIGVNYLGDFANCVPIDGNTMHANYIFWRNSTVMSMSYNSVMDLAKFNCRHKATIVVPLKEKDVNDMVLGLIKSGKLLVRSNAKFSGYSNHLVSTK